MSIDTRPLPEQDEHSPQHHDLSVGELFRRLYALFYNKRFGLLLILAMAVFTLVGVLFPQAPGDVLADPESRAQWLQGQEGKYGNWAGILAAVGIFGVFSGIPFMVVTILLALSIIACTTHRLPLLYNQAMKPRIRVRPTFFDHARTHATTVVKADEAATAEVVRRRLLKERYRVTADENGVPLYADRNRFAPFGTVVAHAAFVVILAGVFVTSAFGFRVDDLSVPIGTKVEVGRGTGLAVEALSFKDSYNPDGSPNDYVSDLVLYQDGQQVASQTVRVNAPLNWDGWSLNQASFGIAADLKVTTPEGRVVYDQSIPLAYQTSDRQYAYGRVDLEAEQLQIYLITPASGQVVDDIPAGKAQIEVYQFGQNKPMFQTILTPGEPATGAGHDWTFARERQYTGLMLSRDPGAIWVWIGSALLAIGTCWTMFLRHKRLWIRLEPVKGGTRVSLASPDRHDVTFERSVHRLVATLGGNESKR